MGEILERLICPACRLSLTPEWLETGVRGVLRCPGCRVAAPVIHGFPLFTEECLPAADAAADLDALDRRLFGEPGDQERFLRAKRRRPVYDAYAAFSPWNEAERAIFPLLPLLRERVSPGDLILDLWCRTGWSGELLASLFPEQTVLAVWESVGNVLGTKGFRFWLGRGRRRRNLEVVFTDPDDPLPFADETFALVHGHDALHRYRLRSLIPECLRVAKSEASLVFPHVHLTNSEPEPFFERGERQLHGRDYSRWFASLFASSGRRGFVLSERELFEAQRAGRVELRDQAETDHYNACVLITAAANEGRTILAEPREPVPPSSFGLSSPLVEVDLSTGELKVDQGGMAGAVDDLLFRHPIQTERLSESLPRRLELVDRRILYWAGRLLDVDQIARRIDLTTLEVGRRLARLEREEVVTTATVSIGMAQLQHYYREQRLQPIGDQATLPALWQRAVVAAPTAPLMVWATDGSEFSYEDADEIARRIARLLVDSGVEPGDCILLPGAPHPEVILAFWGTTLAGAIPVPVDQDLAGDGLAHVLGVARPRIALALAGSATAAALIETGITRYGLATEEDVPGLPSLLGAAVERVPLPIDQVPHPAPDGPALVLFTSGSSGRPKGVVLSHRGLVASADLFDRTFGLRADDRILLAGRLHTMSGLRNSCLTPLISGGAVVLVGGEAANPISIMEAATAHGATVLNTTPAFLAAWLRLPEKARYFSQHKLRLVLCTGATLAPQVRDGFERLFSIPVCDYYGLTETSGLCTAIADRKAPGQGTEAGIGRPVGAIVLVIDERGEELPHGRVGELVVHSEGLMLGYLQPDGRLDPQGRIVNGFLRTGDLAQRTADGCLLLQGRRDRLLIDRHGENVAPETIESALEGCPGVVAAHVVPWTGPDLVPGFLALVVLTGSAEQLLEPARRAAMRALPAARVPSTWIVLDSIPVGASGKWDPAAVRAILAARAPGGAGQGGQGWTGSPPG